MPASFPPPEQIVLTPQVYGAIGDGVHDDTVAIQAAMAAAGAKGGRLYFQSTGHHYKITAPLNIASWHGMVLEGESWETAEIRQYGNNTQIFNFINDNTHSCEIKGLRLTYQTNQNFISHPNSVAIARLNSNGANSLSGIYHLSFRDLKIIGATYGFSVVRTFAGDTTSTNPWWGSQWERVFFSNINRSCIDLDLGLVGAPVNYFAQIKVFQNSGFPNDGGAPALKLKGEANMVGIDVEQWRNQVLYIASANYASVRGLHVEHHYVLDNTGGNRVCYFANAPIDIEGLTVGYDSTDNFPKYAVYVDPSTYVTVRSIRLITPNAGASFLFGGDNTALVQATGLNPEGLVGGVQYWVDGSGFINAVLAIDGRAPVLRSLDVLPTPSVSFRYRNFVVPGNGSTTSDRLVQCVLKSNGSYVWQDVGFTGDIGLTG